MSDVKQIGEIIDHLMNNPPSDDEIRKDMELRRRLAAEKGETIYPEPMGTFEED